MKRKEKNKEERVPRIGKKKEERKFVVLFFLPLIIFIGSEIGSV